ncbi:hypothetical protein TSACC_22852 [Terrimicrobium sacchariphilum]|uniref:Uncharacterized protein n=1 Tax=Terrimicrobium sacchariphilum TaxID=690879 RepID=A0A146GCL1_TERSA|nr:hypothetical protein [Terrimicrobium sacchariphilum]GAT34427.1 hypothetical protein TSACC_22852 [Terrimicrobium sacchariphilum]
MILSRAPLVLSFLVACALIVDAQDDAYRFQNEWVKYESSDNLGLTADKLEKTAPFSFPRPRPAVPFGIEPFADPTPEKGAGLTDRVPVTFTEESGVGREASVRFGFPLPKGAIFEKAGARFSDAKGSPLPAQFTVTSRWPDGSIRWLLIESRIKIEANESATSYVSFAEKADGKSTDNTLTLSQDDKTLQISTGAVTVTIDKTHFNLIAKAFGSSEKVPSAWKSDASGITLTATDGTAYSTAALPPESIAVEESGPERITIRVDGRYGDGSGKSFMRYTTRLTFRRASPVVEIAHTHINDDLSHEFTDIASLDLNLQAPDTITQVLANLPTADDKGARLVSGRELSVFQSSDSHSSWTIDGQTKPGGRTSGSWLVSAGDARVGVAILDFWERWPKGFSAGENRARIGLLPKLPGPTFGDDLPYHLKFPFVSGNYRFKWGMSTTERLAIDLSGKVPRKALLAEIQSPLVAIIPAGWYASTRALGDIPAPQGAQFELWDEFVSRSYEQHMDLARAQREYGFFNYGDWFGERKRNWGNNEYDLAHCFFQQFARTGNTDYFRLALRAARHQADVDIVHAYPDPRYVGANHQHSIGHTGVWEGPNRPKQATWSHAYDEHTDGTNGHTWADGMSDAWCLTGDPRVAEATLELGEHLTWAIAPSFKSLGTHERSAGWSIKALMGLYRLRPDPDYLKAAGQIASVAVKSQTLDLGGAWAHKLPPDHDPLQRVGNCPFLIGILLTALAEYHEQSGDETIWKSLEASTGWLRKAWDAPRASWPYSADTEGKPTSPFYPAHLNPLVVNAIAYVAEKAGHRADMDMVLKSMVRDFAFIDREGFGKELAEQMNFTPDTLGRMSRFYGRNDPQAAPLLLSKAETRLRDEITLDFPSSGDLWQRGPRDQSAALALTSDAAHPSVIRKPYGSARTDAQKSHLTVTNASGVTILEREFSPGEKLDIPFEISGKAGDVFRIRMQDSITGAWRIAGENIRTVLDARSKLHLAGIGQRRLSFFVPAGTASIAISVAGIHQGEYGCALISPDGRVRAFLRASNAGADPMIGGALPQYSPGPLSYAPDQSQTNAMWELALWAAGDIICDIQGVPPYLAPNPENWFNPEVSPATP